MSIKNLILQAYFLVRLPFIWILALAGASGIKKSAGIERILIIRLDRLGDFVLTMPVIDNIKLQYPAAEITVLVRPYLAGLAREIRSIDRVIEYLSFTDAVRLLRKGRFDIAIDMLDDYRIKPALLALFSGAPKRVGFSGGFREAFFTDVIHAGGKRSMVDINLGIVKALGIPIRVSEPRIDRSDPVKRSPAAVVLHPGGYYPSQRWAADRFAELARRITDVYNVEAVIAGGPDDRAAVDSIIAALDPARSRALLPDMKGLAEEFARSMLVICNNSGPLHLAAALGVPTVSTMGPTDPVRWWPRGDKAIVIRKALPCSPCGRGTCSDRACMDLITVDDMFGAAQKILDGTDGITRR